MKKFLIILLFIFTLSILSFSHFNDQYFPTRADSGFDAGYDDYYSDSSWGSSSSGGGSSYWDDDDDYYGSGSSYGSSYGGSYSGGGSASPEVLAIALLICFSPVIVFTIIKLCTTLRDKKVRKVNRIHGVLSRYYNIRLGDGADVKLVQDAYNNYVKIQEAWMNRDLKPIRHLITDEMYNMYQMQVETLIEDNQINVMSHFKFICGRITAIIANKNTETISIVLCVQCRDYIKSATSPKVISGKKHAKITYIYELTFVRDVNQERTTHCPTCGALVKKHMSTNCSHCNNPLYLTSPTMTLSNKKIKYQFKD